MKPKAVFMSCALFLGLMLNSCEFEEPDFTDFSNFKFDELNGRSVNFSFDMTVENPNTLGFKIKSGKLDLTANGKALGVIRLNEKIKIKRKSENKYTVPLTLDLSTGGLFNLAQVALSKDVEIKLDGTVRGKVLGVGKSIPVHESRKIDGSMLKGLSE